MSTVIDEAIEVKLARYTERLDGYIEGQSRLNESICGSLAKFDADLDEIKHWRTRVYGAKSAIFVMGIIFAHSAIVLGSLIAIMNWFSNK